MKCILIPAIALSLLGAEKFPPYPELPKEGNAVLTFDGVSVTQFHFMPDGIKCGGIQPIPESLNPFARDDRTMILQANKRSALQFIWVGGYSGACWIILSINPVADGRYRIVAGEDRKACWADVVPMDERSAEGFEVVPMKWKGLKIPSECRPQDKKRPWPP